MALIKMNFFNVGKQTDYVSGEIGTVTINNNNPLVIPTGLPSISWFELHAFSSTMTEVVLYDSSVIGSGKYESYLGYTTMYTSVYGGTNDIGTASNYSLGISDITDGTVTIMAEGTQTRTNFTDVYWIARRA